tara:strand:- start:277 stop:465 length:189 start_codon:yes stop_codon:yes gene_type:complete
MRDLLDNLREFKKIRKIKQNERPFLQLPLQQPTFDKKYTEEQEKGSRVIIIDLVEGECQIEL